MKRALTIIVVALLAIGMIATLILPVFYGRF